MFHAVASIAQFERERIKEQAMEGLVAARAKGRIGGRPVALTRDQAHFFGEHREQAAHQEAGGCFAVMSQTFEAFAQLGEGDRDVTTGRHSKESEVLRACMSQCLSGSAGFAPHIVLALAQSLAVHPARGPRINAWGLQMRLTVSA